MSNKPTGSRARGRGPATMPAAAPMPPAPPPVAQVPEPQPEPQEATPPPQEPAASPAAATHTQAEAPPAVPAADAQEDPAPPPAASPAPGAALAIVPEQHPGVPVPRNLGAEIPRDSPREIPRDFPRSQVGGGGPVMGFAPRGARTVEDNIIGKKRHPRQETGQLNPGVRLFLSNSVKLYAHQHGIGKGAATDHLLEIGLRMEAPDLVAEQYGARCAETGAFNDWADAGEALLEMAMRRTDEETVLRVLARLKAEAQGPQ